MLRSLGLNMPMVLKKAGIVHMVGPETGRTQPGKFIVCGDSHRQLTELWGYRLWDWDQ